MSTTADRVREIVAPLLADPEVVLYDVEYTGGILRVVLDRPGGVDMGTITEVTRALPRRSTTPTSCRAPTPSRSRARASSVHCAPLSTSPRSSAGRCASSSARASRVIAGPAVC